MAEKDKNVPPRPKITYHVNYLKSRRAAKAWDKKYKKTHKPNGSPYRGQKNHRIRDS